jgi:major membrane immunogen (membrane-anchored lipoprotein)
MKKYLISLLLLFMVPLLSSGQSSDPLISKCAMKSGDGTTYLKDYRVQLGKGTTQPELRIKQVFPLSKNMKYRFTLCNADNSKSQLIMKIKDSDGKLQASSYDPKSGKIYPEVNFTCNKTGTYQIYFDFVDFQPGLGVGIVSLVR